MDRRLCAFLLLMVFWSDACSNKSFVVCSDILNRSDSKLQFLLDQDSPLLNLQNLTNEVCAHVCANRNSTDKEVHFSDLVDLIDGSFERHSANHSHTVTSADDYAGNVYARNVYANDNDTIMSSDCIGSSYINSITSIVFCLIMASIIILCLATALDLKVSSGRLNGLIFYVASIHLNQHMFFKSKGSLSFLFSWFNLDFGFNFCFYNDLSSTSKLWLQLAFPLCVLLLVILIIIAFQYSTLLYNLSVTMVPISSILLVLAYIKVLRTTISILPFKTIAGVGTVWIYDENVQYFESSHLVLVAMSAIFLVFVVPACTLLLIAPQYAYYIATDVLNESKFGLCLSSLIDVYTGRFKRQTRFWFGLILLLYTVQVFIYHFTGGNGLTNLVVTIISSCVLLYINLLLDGVYAEGYVVCNKLEHFLFLNLIAVSALTVLRDSGTFSLVDFCVYVLIFPALLVMINSFIERQVFSKFQHYFKFSIETKATDLRPPPDFLSDYDSDNTRNSYEERSSENTGKRRESLIFDISLPKSTESTASSAADANSDEKKVHAVTSYDIVIDKNSDSNEATLIPLDISVKHIVERDLDGVNTQTIEYTHSRTSCQISSLPVDSVSKSNDSEVSEESCHNSVKAVSKPSIKYEKIKSIRRSLTLTNLKERRNSITTRRYSAKQYKGPATMLSTLLPSMPVSTSVVTVTASGKSLSYSGIKLDIPPGAVDKGVKVRIEIGLLAPHGPFDFSMDYSCVSPILWLYCLNLNFIQFKKPVRVTLPHCLKKVTTIGNEGLGLCFMKATESIGSIMNFRPISFSDRVFSFAENRGVLETLSLNAFFCVTAKHSSSLIVKKAEFCLTRIEPKLWSPDSTILFCVSYLLKSCLEDIEKQFPPEKYKIVKQHFQFQEVANPSISIAVNCLSSDWSLTVENNPTITAKDIHLSNDQQHPLHQLTRECGLYPPRFQLRACKLGNSMSTPSIAYVSFSGTKQSLNYTLDLPLHPASTDSHLNSRRLGRTKSHQGLHPNSSFYKLVEEIEDLKELEHTPYPEDLELRVVHHVATKWREIGTLLIDCNILAEIDEDFNSCRKKMHQVFKVWREGECDCLPYYWSSLVVVLRTEVVGEADLASHLLEDYWIELPYT